MPYTDFTQMPVWTVSMEIGEEIFSLSEALPRKEDYALTSQLRLSALSISANIAEGFGRGGEREKTNFYKYARGSAMQTKNYLIYAMRVKYFGEAAALAAIKKLEQIIHDLNKIIKTLEKRLQP